MKDVLTDIVAHKRDELRRQRDVVSDALLLSLLPTLPTARRSMRQALAQSPTGIIAEFKRRSPSRGWIHRDAQPTNVVPTYERGGASAASILTDEAFFGGTLSDIRATRPRTDLPILRKDFVIDTYQLLQARVVGADAVLLIAACLSHDECRRLCREAHELGLEVLLEVHTEAELAYADCEPDMLGVNNRNLGTFVTDVANSFRLVEGLHRRVAELRLSPERSPLPVSESGISNPATVAELRRAGFRGFLMGEAFMRCDDPGQALSTFISELRHMRSPQK